MNDNGNQDDEKDEEAQLPMTGRRVARRRDDVHGADESSHIWLVSFTDVMALMLTFFVLLFSMAEPETKSWSSITTALQQEFNKFYGSAYERGIHDTVSLDRINFSRALPVSYLDAVMTSTIKESQLLSGVTLNKLDDRLVVSLPQDLLFEPGQAEVQGKGLRALYELGGVLSRIKNRIEIVGHADPRPVETSETYTSNWELTLARAIHVAGVLEGVGYEETMVVRGHSTGRFDDLSQIKDMGQRMDMARRVDIVLMNDDGAPKKLFVDIDEK